MWSIETLCEGLELVPLVVPEGKKELEVKGCYIGDLLSNVMAKAQADQLLFTVITNPNTIAVAHLLGLAGVVLLEDLPAMEETKARAKAQDILLFSYRGSAYEAACRYYVFAEKNKKK